MMMTTSILIQAEFSKSVADTLSYVALSRSLGSLAIAQSMSGNQEIADLLCYASYLYTMRYKADVNNPVVFQALTLCSESKKEWPEHDAPISCISTYTKSNSWVTVSTYGEILQHEMKGNSLKSKLIFKTAFDFSCSLLPNAAAINRATRVSREREGQDPPLQ